MGPRLIASILDASWFVIVVRMALRKHYKEFRIALRTVERETARRRLRKQPRRNSWKRLIPLM
jgi:hypothetical protein